METRQTRRIKISVKIILNIEDNPEQRVALVKGNRFEATVFDISTSGIAIIVKYLLPKGLTVNMEIDGAPFGAKDTMKAKGEIRYCNYIRPHTYNCGVKFLDIPEKYKRYISSFISTHDRREGTRFSVYSIKKSQP